MSVLNYPPWLVTEVHDLKRGIHVHNNRLVTKIGSVKC